MMRPQNFRFFHDQLPDWCSRAFYNAIEVGVRSRALDIICPVAPELDACVSVLEYVYDDHPELFSFYPLKSRIICGTGVVRVKPFYRLSAEESCHREAELDRAVGDILATLFPVGWETCSELEREKRIFDWFTENVVYDQYAYEQTKDGRRLSGSMAWNAYGALVSRHAVCEGIACGFKLLCDRAGLPCIVVLGKAGSRHAWNIVRVLGRFYHVDCTWNLKTTLGRDIPYARYRYFNLPDEIIEKNHVAESRFLPRCGSLRFNPFKMRGLCVRSAGELLELVLAHAGRGEKRFAFMCLGFSPTEALVANCSNRMSAALGGCVVTWYLEDTGVFIGFRAD